ncbi:hypothetical protein NDU88_003562 [Pleurodeles waltl]|uniref:Uncharacterized protein n=1 Tax=Pleurodeles waltl TaxID=8319 RepID=A0AAV7L264_PLEWA|nr:hypothetical protein NDU88_003562 [Pleurodeles waltl]
MQGTVTQHAAATKATGAGNTQVTCSPKKLSLEIKLDMVLGAIEQSSVSLETKIDTVAFDLTLLNADPCKLADKGVLTEQTLEDIHPQTSNAAAAAQSLQDQVKREDAAEEREVGRLPRAPPVSTGQKRLQEERRLRRDREGSAQLQPRLIQIKREIQTLV